MNELRTERLNAFYGKTQILKDISIEAQPGKCICLTGPNGSGKSTLLSILAGITVPNLKYAADTKTEPPVTFGGKPLASFKRKELARFIACMAQNESIVWNYTVRDVILAGRYAHTGLSGSYTERDYEQAAAAAEELELAPLLNRTITTLSGGEFQRVRIARAIAQEAEVLLLDEPAANLDFTFRFSLLDTVRNLARRKNLAVIISIHDLNLAAVFADIIALLTPLERALKLGTPQLHAGSAQHILTPDLLQTAYGQAFGTFIHPEYNCPNVFVAER